MGAQERLRRTKIVCTIGPSCNTPESIDALLHAGMNVARLNFSHGSHEDHAATIKNLRDCAERENTPLALMQDLPGPKDRTGKVKKGGITLREGSEFTLTTDAVLGDDNRVSIEWLDLPRHVKIGQIIRLGDGSMKLEVKSISSTDIVCTVMAGGRLTDNQGISLPCLVIERASITEEDWEHLEFGIRHKVDFVALSFIRDASDIQMVKDFLGKHNATIGVIAKIERPEALENIDAIIAIADGIMVARGDLGIQVPIQKVPMIQKKLIQQCNLAGKPVIVATQMLESMVDSPYPTRAEATDVANAIFDGADALMLSEETAIGRYPRDAVSIMAQIAIEAENALPYDEILAAKGKMLEPKTDDAISYAACYTARQLGAAAIIAFTTSGGTVRRVARNRPRIPILAITPNETTRQRLLLSWGVSSFRIPVSDKMTDLFLKGAKVAKESGFAHEGDIVIITGGVPIGFAGGTNLLKVEKIK